MLLSPTDHAYRYILQCQLTMALYMLPSGIGLGIVRRLAQEGAQVVVSSRKQQNVDEVVSQLKAEGLDVAGTACHVGDKAALKRLVKFAVDTYGKLDILVSNAAVNPTSGPIMTMDGECEMVAVRQ